MKRLLITSLLILLVSATPAWAHFAAIIPSDDILTIREDKNITLGLSFMKPFTNNYYTFSKPEKFGVIIRGQDKSLMDDIAELATGGGNTWAATYKIKKPGDYLFYMTTSPYYVSVEQRLVVQHVKLYVNALGKSGDWNKPLGTLVEIVPLTRPYGIWTGTSFSAKVLVNGEPMAGVTVEVAYMNTGSEAPIVKAPSSIYESQSITTDSEGIFHYVLPRRGWWGFSAIHLTGRSLDGYPVEDGGVIWVRTRDMK